MAMNIKESLCRVCIMEKGDWIVLQEIGMMENGAVG
jgi:hypothetical protein